MKLVLYHYWRSSSSWRVRFALLYKGIPYESRFVNLQASEQLTVDHKILAPFGVVPCLVVDGRALTESVAILEYLEEVLPEKPLLPADPWRRARVRQLVQHVNSGIQPLQNLFVLEQVSKDPQARKAWGRTFNERGLRALESALGSIEQELGRGRYAVGDELTLADIYLVPQVGAAKRFEVPMDPYPRIRRVYEACMLLDAAAAALPENQGDAPR